MIDKIVSYVSSLRGWSRVLTLFSSLADVATEREDDEDAYSDSDMMHLDGSVFEYLCTKVSDEIADDSLDHRVDRCADDHRTDHLTK